MIMRMGGIVFNLQCAGRVGDERVREGCGSAFHGGLLGAILVGRHANHGAHADTAIAALPV
jgi:hypothetical protein